MHTSVRMTSHIIYGFWSCTSLFERLSILFFGFRYAHICTNDYPYYFLIFDMHISLRMTIHIIFGFRHANICMNDYQY